MIFGKSDEQRYKEEQERLEYLYNNWPRKFAWWPVKLYNGQIAWLQWVYVKYDIRICGSGWYYYNPYWCRKLYYLENNK